MSNFNNLIPFYYSTSGNREEDKKLLEPIRYILQVPGKGVRTKLAEAINYWLKISPDKIQEICDITEIIHNSGILMDDIQDNSILRRGIPVAHSVYGIASTLSAATYGLLITLEKVNNLKHPAAIQVYTEQLLEADRGQAMEIFWRDNSLCPTEEDYKTMTIRKTGAVFNLSIRLMKLFSTYEKDFSSLMATLGLYFQIRDDYGNLCLDEFTQKKGYCEDLTEGKIGFPIIHAVASNPEDKRIINIVRQRTKDIEVKRHCVELLERFGSFKYTRNVLEELDSTARAEIERLGGNPLLVKILDGLKDWDIQDAPKDPLTGTF